MRGLISFIGSVLLTFLPPRYRRDTSLRAAAIVAGIAEAWLAIFILVYRIIEFSRLQESRIGARSEALFDRFGGAAVYESGVIVFFEFALQPLHMFLLYLFFEGAIRILAALVGHQVIGSLPLYAISGIHSVWDRVRYKRDLGKLVIDEVIRGTPRSDYALKVYSCRPKLDWNPYVTIEFEDEFYQMFREEPGDSPRRFVYYLRKNPVGRIVVKIRHYKIDDVMKT